YPLSMQLALNGATIIHSPLEDDVDIAADCGFDALELWAAKLDPYLASHTLDDLAGTMRDRGIQPWCINSIEDITFRDHAGRTALLAQLDRTTAIARAVGAPSIVVVPGRRPDGYNAHESVEVVLQVDRPNVGMVIDTFHFYAGGSRLDDIARVPIDKLFVVHLNGCEDLPRDQLTDAHRLYPGEGPIPIEAILRALQTRGFDGTCSVEIFRP